MRVLFADEDCPLRTSSPCSASKAAADLLVLSYVRTYGLPAIITRSSNNYGPDQFPENLLPLMITNAFQDKSPLIYGDGKQERDWLHVEDNCRGILTVFEIGKLGEVYNIGGPDVTQNLSLVRERLRLTGKPDTLISYVQDRPGHDHRYALTCQKIETQLGWKPAISLHDGLRQTIEWYRSHQKWLDDVRAGEYRAYPEKYYDNRSHSLHAIAVPRAQVGQ